MDLELEKSIFGFPLSTRVLSFSLPEVVSVEYVNKYEEILKQSNKKTTLFTNSILNNDQLETVREYNCLPLNTKRYLSPIQNIKHEFRDAIFSFSEQIDFSNSNYSILCGFLNRFTGETGKTTFPVLFEFQSNPSVIFDLFLNQGIDKQKCKKTINGLIFGYSLKTFQDEYPQLKIPEQIEKLSIDILNLRSFLMQLDFMSYFKPKNKDDLSAFEITNATITNFLTTIESNMILLLADTLDRLEKKVVLIVHDAIEFIHTRTTIEADTLLLDQIKMSAMEKGFYNEINLKWHDKTPSKQWVDEQYELISHNPEPEDVYLIRKRYFEKELGLCKVLNPFSYYVLVNKNYQSLTKQTLKDLFEHERVPGKKTDVPFIERWLKDPDMKIYLSSGIYTEQTPENHLNLFCGFDVERMHIPESDMKSYSVMEELTDLKNFFFYHMRRLVDNDDHAEWWKKYIAHMFKFPSVKPRVCPILQSFTEGNGKGLFEQIIRKMIGNSYSNYTNDPEAHLLGNFNPIVENCMFLVLDESHVLRQDLMEKFKSLITAPEVIIRKMQTNAYKRPCCIRFCMTTNKTHPIIVSDTDRRFFISRGKFGRLSQDHVDKLLKIANDERVLRLIYNELLEVDVFAYYDFANARPVSDNYTEVREMSRPKEILFVAEYVDSQLRNNHLSFIPPTNAQISSHQIDNYFQLDNTVQRKTQSTILNVTASDLYDKYKEHMTRCNYDRFLQYHPFISELVRHFDVKRNDEHVNQYGVRYYKERSSQKCVWAFQVDLFGDWLLKENIITLEDLNFYKTF